MPRLPSWIRPGDGHSDAGPARRWAQAHGFLLACLAVTAVAVPIYLQPVSELGFYYDDWPLLAALDDAPSSTLPGLFEACRTVEPAGRPGTCMYHATVNWILGDDARGYHVMSIIFLVVAASLLYGLLRRCRLGHWTALLSSLLFVTYPGSDSTRLWPTGAGAQYILVVYLAAVLLAIEALRRRGRAAIGLHLASLGLFVLLFFTYEAVLVMIAFAAALYLVAVPDNRKAALWRGAADLTLVCVFVVYRFVLAPVNASAGFTQERTISETIDRVRVVLEGAWASWKPLFLPTTAAPVVVFVAAGIWIVAMADDRTVRRASRRWLIATAAAIAFAIASLLPYVIANDLYVPDTSSLFNRMNFAAAPAYCVLFAALCGLLWTALVHWVPRAAAGVVVGALVLAVGVTQVNFERDSQASWAAAWQDQKSAIHTLQRVAPRIDADASIMSFGHPIWERGFIPVFAAGWDLRGAIDLRTGLDPPLALPFVDAATCGATGVLLGGAPYATYRDSHPLWFVNLSNGQALRIQSARDCNGAVARWGRPPFWGTTVTGAKS